jgi:hypothetical protein
MKRLAASFAFATVVLIPVVSFATSQSQPCDATCKYERCMDQSRARANIVCRGVKLENGNRDHCIESNWRKFAAECMHAQVIRAPTVAALAS